ncbi:hypothetical protein D0Z06_14595 [Geodermatophilus marinus]|nr:hypothetical protein D0Z06_14595 [Geodermatophilus sp. LHW52908]
MDRRRRAGRRGGGRRRPRHRRCAAPPRPRGPRVPGRAAPGARRGAGRRGPGRGHPEFTLTWAPPALGGQAGTGTRRSIEPPPHPWRTSWPDSARWRSA